ncbi:MAG: CbtA family protein, partial [Acidimicrobiales bacterium]
ILAVAAMAMRGAWLDPFRRAVLAGSILAASLTIVPWLKYAPNPPAVGDTATGGERQRYFWLLVGLTGLILAAAANLSSRLRDRGWPDTRRVATLVLATVVVLGVVLAVMPAVNDPIPAEVPANLIWRFRVASLTGNLLLWGGLIMAFGLLWAERSDAAVATGPAVPPGSGEPGSSPQNSMPFRAETPAS